MTEEGPGKYGYEKSHALTSPRHWREKQHRYNQMAYLAKYGQ